MSLKDPRKVGHDILLQTKCPVENRRGDKYILESEIVGILRDPDLQIQVIVRPSPDPVTEKNSHKRPVKP